MTILLYYVLVESEQRREHIEMVINLLGGQGMILPKKISLTKSVINSLMLLKENRTKGIGSHLNCDGGRKSHLDTCT